MSAFANVIPVGNYQSVARPRLIPLYCDDSLATITAAGYLNAKFPNRQFFTGDWVQANYDTGFASNGLFTVAVSNGVATMTAFSNGGEVTQVGAAVTGNLPKYNNTSGDIEDSGIAAADALLQATDVTDYQQFVSIQEIILASAGTWTKTRVAQGNYVYRHTAADDTSVLGIDLTPQIRAAAGRGFKLASIDVGYSIGTLALDAHSFTLDKINYANNAAVTVTSVPLTGSLATATQANPYLSNLVVTTPAFDNTVVSKYVAELTVNAAATSDYDFYGLNLHFTKSVA